MDRVQQYVARQRAFLPTYTAEGLVDGRRLPESDAKFGFDTPVLRPRAPRAHLAPPRKREKASTPDDTDGEREARLADRRERKRKKRAIVNPSHKDDDESVPTAAPKTRRTKKPAALALLYGFSAANVTKDRLTLKPAPSLGVFSKGRASAKKKISATKKSSSKKELFSEFAFLNKSSERATDPFKADDDSNESSTFGHPETRVTKLTKKHGNKCTKTTALKTSARTTAESEVWDIEVQSGKLPSSAPDVANEPEAAKSIPAVPDLRPAEWSATVNEECENRRNRAASLSGTQSQAIGSHAADVSSLHPSHSASQIGRRAANSQESELRLVTSKYFTGSGPVLNQELAAIVPQTSTPNDDIHVQGQVVEGATFDARTMHQAIGDHATDTQRSDPRRAVPEHIAEPNPAPNQDLATNHLYGDQGAMGATLDAQTIFRVASPTSAATSTPLRVAEFRTRYDMDVHEILSDSCVYDDCRGADVPLAPLGLGYGYFASPIVETQGDRFIGGDYAFQDDVWDWHPWVNPGDQEHQDLLTQEYEGDFEQVQGACFIDAQDDMEEGYYVDACSMYESVSADGSICYSEEGLDEMVDFLEGRALLLGVHERGRHERLSGLVAAEMDVANRLRDHWRPLRF